MTNAGVVIFLADKRYAGFTANVRLTAFLSIADVAVVADQRRTCDAFPCGTGVACGADVAVLAGVVVVRMHAPDLRLTTVVCTRIVVLATRGYTGRADAGDTLVSNGAGIAVFAGEALMVCH